MKKLIDLGIDKVIMLSLPRSNARRERAIQSIVDSGLCEREEIEIYFGMDGNDLEKAPTWWKGHKNEWACLISHSRILEIIAQNGWRNTLVFEDDVIVRPNAYEYLECLMDAVPDDYTALYLGGHHWGEPEYHPKGFVKNQLTTGLYARVISQTNLPRMIQHMLHYSDYEPNFICCDTQISRGMHNGFYKCYSPRWFFVGHEAGISTIKSDINKRTFNQYAFSDEAMELPLVLIRKDEYENMDDEKKRRLNEYVEIKRDLEGLEKTPSFSKKLEAHARSCFEFEKLPAIFYHEDKYELVSITNAYFGNVMVFFDAEDFWNVLEELTEYRNIPSIQKYENSIQ